MEILNLRSKSASELKVFLTIISVTAWLQQQFGDAWDEATNISELVAGVGTCKVILDLSAIYGTPYAEEIIVPIENRIWLDFSGSKSPLHGSHLMLWGYAPKITTLFFWTTEMVTVYSQGEYHDPPQTD